MVSTMKTLLPLFVVLVAFATFGDALGCLRTICSANQKNELRQCGENEGNCGYYKAKRRNNQMTEAVDLLCPYDEYVFAPFDGEISYHQPFGGEHDMNCADQGARIDGTGQWRGYHIIISTVLLHKYGGKVQAGEKIGIAGNIECGDGGQKKQNNDNYLLVELYREGKAIDPTHHLIDCMCTGQICETNVNNALIGEPFKGDSRYNGVRGWELRCPMANDADDYGGDDEKSERAAIIYSPIDGDLIGRIRLQYADGVYGGCDNEGIFIEGTGKWEDYEVRMYNVRYRDDLGFGKKRIEQGQPVGHRLTCPNSPNTVFVEIRFQGAVVNVTDAVTASNCKHPPFSNIF